MNFDLNEEQVDIRDMVQRFTAQEITPYAEQWDENNYFPAEVYTKMATLGLMGMTTAEEYGGSMLSRLSGALVYEELAKGEMATAVGLFIGVICLLLIYVANRVARRFTGSGLY